GADIGGTPCLARLDPVLMERQQAEVAPDRRAEAVHVGTADAAPVAELDAQLERSLRPADEVDLVDLQEVVERLEVRHRRLADADRADQLRLDQPYVVARPK